MAAMVALLLLVALLGPSLSDAFAHLPDYDTDWEYGIDVSTFNEPYLCIELERPQIVRAWLGDTCFCSC